MDLLSVVTHEFGHKLGFDHGDAFDVMAPVLAPSVQGVISSPRLDRSQLATGYAYVVSWEHSLPLTPKVSLWTETPSLGVPALSGI